MTEGLPTAPLSGETVAIFTPMKPSAEPFGSASKSDHAGISSSVEAAPSGRSTV